MLELQFIGVDECYCMWLVLGNRACNITINLAKILLHKPVHGLSVCLSVSQSVCVYASLSLSLFFCPTFPFKIKYKYYSHQLHNLYKICFKHPFL